MKKIKDINLDVNKILADLHQQADIAITHLFRDYKFDISLTLYQKEGLGFWTNHYLNSTLERDIGLEQILKITSPNDFEKARTESLIIIKNANQFISSIKPSSQEAGQIGKKEMAEKRKRGINEALKLVYSTQMRLETQYSRETFSEQIFGQIKFIGYMSAVALLLDRAKLPNRSFEALMGCAIGVGSLERMRTEALGIELAQLNIHLNSFIEKTTTIEKQNIALSVKAANSRAKKYAELSRDLWKRFLEMEDHNFLMKRYRNSGKKLSKFLRDRFIELGVDLLNTQPEWFERRVIGDGKKGLL